MMQPILSGIKHICAIALCLLSFQFDQTAGRSDLGASAICDSDGMLNELCKGPAKAKHKDVLLVTMDQLCKLPQREGS